MRFDFPSILTPRVLVGIISVAAVLLILAFIGAELSAPAPVSGDVVAVLTVIPAPSGTPVPAATPTLDPNAPTLIPTPAPGEISVGSYVQIKGTEGQGLRIRSEPGLNSNPLFIGYDAEVFVIKDGPRQADGYSWYYLVAPYDETRAGWAASDFLNIIPAPQQ
jgi:hypothetical protein